MNRRRCVGSFLRAAALLVAALSTACGSSTDSDEERDAPEPGTAGAHVWDAQSESLELRNVWSYGGPANVPPQSGSSCRFFARSTLSDAQRDVLEALKLVPITDACTYDGYMYDELTVIDRDGSEFTYRDTGCNYLRIEGAQAMLPANAFPADVFPADAATVCDE